MTRLKPDHAAAWAQLARLFMIAGQPGRADKALVKAVEHNDDNPLVLDTIAAVYTQLGDQEEAGAWIRRALDKQPANVNFQVNLAHNYMFRGKLDEAEDVLKQALAAQPDNPNAHWVLSSLRKAVDRSHVDVLKQLVENDGRSPQAMAFLYYGLCK